MNILQTTSSYLQDFIKSYEKDLKNILEEVEKTRITFDDMFYTLTIIEQKRKNQSVMIILDSNNHIEKTFYGLTNKETLEIVSMLDTANTIHLVDTNSKYSCYKNGIKDLGIKPKFIDEVIIQYKYQQTFKKFDDLISNDDYKVYAAYLVGMKSEVKSTKVGCTGYNSLDELVSDGYNALKPELNKSDRYLINVTALLPTKLDEFLLKNPELNKSDFIKEVYDFHQKITGHAEANAILNIKNKSINMTNGHLVVPFHPCDDCASKIVNLLEEQNSKAPFTVLIDPNFKGNLPEEQKNWLESIIKSKNILNSNNVTILEYQNNSSIIKFNDNSNALKTITEKEKEKSINI